MIHKGHTYLLAAWVALIGTLALCACQRTAGNEMEAWAFSDDGGASWGLLGADGQILMPAGSFRQQPSSVVGGMFSVPDEEGRFRLHSTDSPLHPVSPRSFARVGHFFADVALAQEEAQGPILLIDRRGNNIASTTQYPQYDIVQMHNFSNGRALFITSQGKHGYLDTRGNVAVPPIYDLAYDYHEGTALVGMNNSQGETGFQLIDTDGHPKGSVRLSGCLLDTRLSDGRLLFKEQHSGHLGLLDERGNVVSYLPESVLRASRSSHRMIVTYTANGAGSIDEEGNPLIPALYQDMRVVGDDRMAVYREELWKLWDADGQPVTPQAYDSIGRYLNDRFAIVRQGKDYGLMNREGKLVGTTHTQIAESPADRGLLPQVFTIGKGEHTRNVPATATRTPHKPAEPTSPTPIQIEQKDWREVARQHPFYAEAIKVTSGKLEETDAENRRMILNYVEHLRTSYTTKDIDFLEQLFSEHALIVVGTVVHAAPQEEKNYLSPSQVVYNVKSKREYLARLREVFKANRQIDVTFSDFHIMRHPTRPGIYGVNLRQQYRSDIYSDDGYLFLLWDFRDETSPKIHVRTWQPRMQADHTPLPESELFNISNFNLE